MLDGIKNQVRSKLNLTIKEEEKLFNKRRKICNECNIRVLKTDTCGICGCPIDRITKSIKYHCPNFYW